MTASPEQPEPASRQWWSVVWIGAATIAIEAVAYVGVRGAGGSSRSAALAVLAVSAVWMAIPVFASGGRRAFDMLVRGGVVADATGASLLGLWLVCPVFGFLSAIKVYAVLASMALAGMAVVCWARSDRGKLIVAAVVAVATLAALTTPFWGNGLLLALDGSARQSTATGLVAVNPAFSLASATARDLRWVWNEAPLMYRLTVLGQVVPTPVVAWYVTPLIWLGVAAVATPIAVWRRRVVRDAAPEDPPASA